MRFIISLLSRNAALQCSELCWRKEGKLLSLHLSRCCQFYTRCKYPGPRESVISPKGLETSFPWLPLASLAVWLRAGWGPHAGAGAPRRKLFQISPLGSVPHAHAAWAADSHAQHAGGPPSSSTTRATCKRPPPSHPLFFPYPPPHINFPPSSRKNIWIFHDPPVTKYAQAEERE